MNWKVGISEERLNNHGHMMHAFASLVNGHRGTTNV